MVLVLVWPGGCTVCYSFPLHLILSGARNPITAGGTLARALPVAVKQNPPFSKAKFKSDVRTKKMPEDLFFITYRNNYA